jgi:hypothetical protein
MSQIGSPTGGPTQTITPNQSLHLESKLAVTVHASHPKPVGWAAKLMSLHHQKNLSGRSSSVSVQQTK